MITPSIIEHNVEEGLSWWECSCGRKGVFITAKEILAFSGCPGELRYIKRHGVDQYRKMYNRGWRRSENVGSIPDTIAAEDDAWMDGYLDSAVGRPKWHKPNCPNHDDCP